ncbi:uncharacterized protein LOC141763808 [Sebastes fasciatus]|uniref:uncharacterized protein LOC141763808 n=1 Tax=Sebastes fasciatus TaxID=394691 RepID=UPI003D9ED898
MESWFCWIYFVILLRNISADPASPPSYIVHRTNVSFDKAAEGCSPGVLTTLTTEQEVADILKLVSEPASLRHQNEFTFWVGLRKVKDECVVSTLPLRGFKWTEDGSEDTEVSQWTEEPQHTCTTVRCAALKGEFNGSAVTRWGLIPVTCKNSYQFICKLRDRETGVRPATPKPATREPKPATTEPPKFSTPEPPKSATPEPPTPARPEPPTPATSANPEPRPATHKPEPAKPEPNLPEPKPEADLKPKTGSELQGTDRDPEPAPGSDSCQHPHIPEARSISLDRDNSSRIQVECWPTDRLELHCSGRPAMWRMLDDSAANFTTVCLPCGNGFQKDTSGNCVDMDECSGGATPCRHTCLNTEGSYRCFCSDENGKQHEEDSPACVDTERNGMLIPLLVAAAVLVVLVVVIAVTLKCCLMRRSKKLAMKRAEKMAMKSKNGKDSFETANEKAAT